MYEAIFLDRDGTIGGDHNIHYPGEFKLFDYTTSIIKDLKQQNIKIFSFTNQPGISQGLATEDEFIKELSDFGFDDIYLCPHGHQEGCECRKPQAGMLLKAAENHNLNLHNCVVIGDRWTDIVAANKAGCIKILVKTGAGNESLTINRNSWVDVEADYIAENLKDAINWLFTCSK